MLICSFDFLCFIFSSVLICFHLFLCSFFSVSLFLISYLFLCSYICSSLYVHSIFLFLSVLSVPLFFFSSITKIAYSNLTELVLDGCLYQSLRRRNDPSASTCWATARLCINNILPATRLGITKLNTSSFTIFRLQ